MNCRTKFSRLHLVAALFVVLASSAFAQTCVQNEYNLINKQNLKCTANDVRIAEVANIRDPITGNTITTCVAGQQFNFIADFKIVTTSSQARENIGLYIATNSQTQALTGSCVDNIISPQHACHAGSSILCGSDNYHETDPAPDNCGDTSSGDNSTSYGPGAEKVTLEITNFVCQAPAGTNQVQLPNCTSWQIPGGTIQCSSPAPTYPYPFDTHNLPEAIPGSPAKCNCGIIPLGITVQSPSVTVKKTCNTNVDTQAPDFTTSPPTPNSCSITPEGGQVTYSVNISNTSNFGNITVDQVCDSAYGTIFQVSGFAGTACPSGSKANAPDSTTCGASVIAQGSSATCTFTATQAENITVQNIVNVRGHGSSPFGPTASNQVTVVSNEAPTTGTITKSLVGTRSGCATVRYGVEVRNTSAAGTDESLNLSAVNDTAFGSITTVHDDVKGTTCGVDTAAHGLGTMSALFGAGVFPVTIPVNQGTYTCQFDAQFCGGLDQNGCFSHANTVSATLTDDDSATVTLTPGSLNVKECLVGSTQ
jgi:hypothetical protein